MKKRPVIGVTLDSEQPGGYSKYPWYALRQNYADAIIAAGGLPVALPHDAELAGAYLARLDGLVVTGGAFDVDPALYGDAGRHATVTLKEGRTAAEMALTRGALAMNMPVLGICGGDSQCGDEPRDDHGKADDCSRGEKYTNVDVDRRGGQHAERIPCYEQTDRHCCNSEACRAAQ